MNKFLFLLSGGSMPESEAEIAAVMQRWGAWYTNLGSALVDPGNPIAPTPMTVSTNGSVRNGSSVGMPSGYVIIQADSMAVAVQMAQSCPALDGGSEITVFETSNIM
jgi:hypothetical protein